MPSAKVQWDKESLMAILLGASYKLFWHQEYGVSNPIVEFQSDASGNVCGASVTVSLDPKEKK